MESKVDLITTEVILFIWIFYCCCLSKQGLFYNTILDKLVSVWSANDGPWKAY